MSSSSARKILRSVSSALDKPSERRKASFSASKGEVEENLEIKLLNLGLMVQRKIAVMDGDAVSVPYFEVSTKDGLPFFVALTSDYRVARASVEKVGAFGEGAQGIAADEIVAAARQAFGLLCDSAFAAGGNYCFFERDDQTEVSVTAVVFEESTGSETAARGPDASRQFSETPQAFPLVSQDEILSAPEETLNNISEAWRQLYELGTERSTAAMAALTQIVGELVDAHDRLAGAVVAASSVLADGIGKLVESVAPLRDQARMGNQDATAIIAAEAALSDRHAAMRKLHAAAARLDAARDVLVEACDQVNALERELSPLKNLAVQT